MRKLATAAAVSFCLTTVSGSINALSLGEIEMYSTLNQPLDAEIYIVAAQPDELRGLLVRSSASEGYAHAGGAPALLAGMRFSVDRRPDGVSVIKVTSDAPVIEPFLNFQLNIETGTGERLVREYTVLLDPPVFNVQTTPSNPLLPTAAGGDDFSAGAAAILRAPQYNVVPQSGVAIDFSDEIIPPQPGAQVADLRQAELVDVQLDGLPSQTAPLPGAQSHSAALEGYAPKQESVGDEIATVSAAKIEPVYETDLDDYPDVYSRVVELEEPEQALPSGVQQTPHTPLMEVPIESVGMALTPIGSTQTEPKVESVGELNLATDLQPDTTDSMATSDTRYRNDAELITLSAEILGLEDVASSRSATANPSALSVADKAAKTGPLLEAPIDLNLHELAVEESTDYSDGVPVSLEELGGPPLSPENDSHSSKLPASRLPGSPLFGDLTTEVMMVEFRHFHAQTAEILAADRPAADEAANRLDLDREVLQVPPIFDRNDSDADGGEPAGEKLDLERELLNTGGPVVDPNARPFVQPGSDQQQVAVDSVTVPIPPMQYGANQPSNYVVQASDTLWAVAADKKPSGVSTQQMMVALLRANQQAFVGGDMNRLQNGAILRVPSLAEIQNYDESQALSMVREQAALWETYRGNSAATLVSPGGGVAEDSVDTQGESSTVLEVDRLRIVGVDGSTAADEVGTEGENSGIATSLDETGNGQLAAEQAISDAMADAEAADRNRELEENGKKVKRLITLQESELSELQNQLDGEVVAPTPEELAQEKANVEDQLEVLQQQVSSQAGLEQEAISATAAAELNAAASNAQARSQKLAGEEDALHAQIAALQSERRDLEATEQTEKAQLVQQAEQDKLRLLGQAQAERAQIAADLDVQKIRIAERAEAQQQALAQQVVEQQQVEVADDSDAAAQLVTDNVTSAVSEVSQDTEIQLVSDLAPVAGDEVSIAGDESAAVSSAGESIAEPQVPTATLAETSVEQSSGFVQEVKDKVAGSAFAPMLNDRKTLLGAGAGLALLGLLGAWALRRKSKSGRAADVRQRRAATATAASQPAPANIELTGVSPDPHTVAAAGGRHRDATDPQVAAERPPVAKAVDKANETLSEADVYLAYGLHGQAEDLLVAAIDRSPDNAQYQMKLIETYRAQENHEKFRLAAANYHDRFEDPAGWERITELGHELDGNANSASIGAGAAAAAAGAAAGAAALAGAAADTAHSGSAANAVKEADQAAAQLSGSGLDDVSDYLRGTEDFITRDDDSTESLLDQTIDPGEEFEMSELVATGEFSPDEVTSALEAESSGFELHDFEASEAAMKLSDDPPAALAAVDATLDELDMSLLDDDGTLNLEEIVGDGVSGLDIGSLDLTQPDLPPLDNLTLDNANLDSLGDVPAKIRAGLADDNAPLPAVDNIGEMETMLDLAKAYLDMGDVDSASSALQEIAAGGSEAQRAEAQQLLNSLD